MSRGTGLQTGEGDDTRTASGNVRQAFTDLEIGATNLREFRVVMHPAIRVQNLTKQFRLGTRLRGGLNLTERLARVLRRARSEERRVGKERRSRGLPAQYNKKAKRWM